MMVCISGVWSTQASLVQVAQLLAQESDVHCMVQVQSVCMTATQGGSAMLQLHAARLVAVQEVRFL